MRAFTRVSLFVGFIAIGLSHVNALEVPEANYPALPKSALSAEGFVPQGWMIEIQEQGDLNQDGISDMLLVLSQDDPANVVANEPDSLGLREIDTNPRILFVAFGRKKGGYELALENHDFIPRYDTPTIDDPFGRAGIVDGRIEVGLHYWANAGSWYTDDRAFIFMYRDGAFRLVGYKDFTTKRNTGETWDLSIDYLASEAEITLGSFSDDAIQDKTYKKPLPSSPLSTIEELGSGWEYRPEQADISWWGLREMDSEDLGSTEEQ